MANPYRIPGEVEPDPPDPVDWGKVFRVAAVVFLPTLLLNIWLIQPGHREKVCHSEMVARPQMVKVPDYRGNLVTRSVMVAQRMTVCEEKNP